VDTLIRFKESGFVPDRDLVLALTADEELGATSRYNGVRWLLQQHRALIDAGFAINEGGGVELRNGRPILSRVQTREKVPVHFRLEVATKGGQTARPEKDNAFYRLGDGLARLGKFQFPVNLNETTRMFFERSAGLRASQLADDMRAVAATQPDAAAA